MSSCAVAACKNHMRKTRNRNVAYHRFPSDPILQKIWIEKCNRNGSYFKVCAARICSEHFLEEDYKRDLMAELMNTRNKKMLKPNAVPSQKLLASDQPSLTLDVRNGETNEQYTMQKIVNVSPCVSPSQKDLCTSTGDDCLKQLEEKVLYLENKVKKLTNSNKRLLSLNKSLMKSMSTLRRSSMQAKNLFSKKLRAQIKNVFKNIISDNQVKCLITKKDCKEWNKEEMCKAICLRSISRNAYLFLRHKLNLPFPCLTTLQRWVNTSIACQPGILQDILKLMEAKSNFLSDSEKICILSFDEMSVDNQISYDQAEDRILSPYNTVQVVMLRGLFSSWKQPIFFGFDVTMTKGLLFEIISAVENASFNVAGIVSDLVEKNRSLWISLSVNHNNPSFLNPANSDKNIWVFANVPNLLKQLRSNLLDYGLTLPNNHCIGKSVLDKLFFINSKLFHEQTVRHKNVHGNERQKLDLVVQFFSSQTAKFLKLLMPEEETSMFFQLTNDFFHIFNFRDTNNPALPPCGFGSNIKAQQAILNNFYNLIEGLRVGKKTQMLPFQKGFLLTINALMGLYADMKVQGNTNILTSRLNQDCLEDLFSCLKELGTFHDSLLPSEVISRMRLLLLGNTETEFSSGSRHSVQLNKAGNFLTSSMLNPLFLKKPIDNFIEDDIREDSVISALKEDFTKEDLTYLAGYIRFKCKADEDLSDSSVLLRTESDDLSIRWMKNIYQEGLMISSVQYLQLIEEFELVFNELHGHKGLSREKGVIKKLCTILSEKYPLVSAEVIKCFAITRTFIQIKCMNQHLKSLRS